MDHLEVYERVWARVRKTYESGHMVYEPDLQAALYAELRQELPLRGVVVEPLWENIPSMETVRPDLVIVSNNEIVDICELKFVPHWHEINFEYDIQKLLGYQGLQDPQHVTLNPSTGRWGEPLPISPDCRLHFVVVGNSESKAVWPENISDRVIHWYGRVGQEPRHWGVCKGENPN